MQKDIISFWKQWNSTFEDKNKHSCVDGLHAENSIADQFASAFANICTPNSEKLNPELKCNFDQMLQRLYILETIVSRWHQFRMSIDTCVN